MHLEGLIREDYHEEEEVQKLIEKTRNGLGHSLTFVTKPDVDSENNRAGSSGRAGHVAEDVPGSSISRRRPDSRDNHEDVSDGETAGTQST